MQIKDQVRDVLTRTAWNKLEAWKARKHHPLIVQGLRQTGKTYIVKAFAEDNYKHVVYLDLRANSQVHSAFDGNFDVDTMITAITAADPTARFVPGETVLILDEIQDCPNARSSLKYWDLDGRYDVMATGSFMGVKGFRDPYKRGVPVGYEEFLYMYPLSFREFIENAGLQQEVLDSAKAAIENKTPVQATIHSKLRELYLNFLIVGGMPEAVVTFFETHDVNAVREVQTRILTSIQSDFGRYKDSEGNDAVNETLKLRAEACLNSLPSQLAKEYKKFQYSRVDVRGRSVDKADGLQYLVDMGLVVKSYNLSDISTPLEGAKKANEFKAFFIDSGLLISRLDATAPSQILQGNLSAYKGAITENMVASACAVQEVQPYYFRGSSGSPEIDVVIMYKGQPTLIESKTTNGRMTSMKYVLEHPKKYGKHPAIKLADTNVGGGKDFVTYPLYALGILDWS